MSILAIISSVIIVLFILMYNSLMNKKNQLENAFAGMDVQLKKRYDVIPNLINTVKTYMKHEENTLREITSLRTKAVSRKLTKDQKIGLNNALTSKLSELMINIENYPDLKASENFIQLQQSFNEIESQISAARRNYNAQVTTYNNSLDMFPTNIVAKIIQFQRKDTFEIPEKERENIDASALFDA